MKVALYKGRTRLSDRLVQWWTNSPYSHCEVIGQEFGNGQSACWSSSMVDGGVRCKVMTLDPAKWDIVEIPADTTKVVAWFVQHLGEKYDFLGLAGCVFRFMTPVGDRWFCSEAIAEAMGYPESWRVVPADLANMAKFAEARYGIA